MSLAQDVRYAFRMIRQNPWFSAAIIGTLALGIGVNTTIFTLVNAVLFKPLPFPGGERLVMAGANQPSQGREFVNISYADFRDFRQGASTFERLEAFSGTGVTISENGNPAQRFRGAYITWGLFEMLQVQPVAGRRLTAADEAAGAPQVILLGYGAWAERYAKDPNVIGRAVRVNEKTATIAGVMPEGFKFPNNEDVWLATVPDADREQRSRRDFRMVGMLKPGVRIVEAQADLGVVAHRLSTQFPDTHKEHGAAVKTFHEVMNGGQIRLVFLLMMGAVGFVLLIACANVANMLLSRAISRSREISVRAALGASRWRIIRQLLVESIVLAVIGGIAGLSLTILGTRAFSLAVADVGKPYWIDFSVDYVVFAYFALVSILAGLVFGLFPALQAMRVDLNHSLKEGSRSAGGRRTGWLSGALVVFQFMLAVVLLSGAGLMIRSFLVAQNEFSNIPAERILSARVILPDSRYSKPEDRQHFFERLIARAGAIPGVQAATVVSHIPGQGFEDGRIEIAGRPAPERERRPAVAVVTAAPGYFHLMGLNLSRGRDFEDSDGLPGKETVLISPEFIRRHFPNEDPMGKQIRLMTREGQPRPWMTITGIVPELRQSDPGNPIQNPAIYVPYRFESPRFMAVLLRTATPAVSASAAVRSEVQEMDGELPLFEVRTLLEQFDRGRWYLRVFGTLFMIFAGVATGMAGVGIYAVVAHATSRRTQEIGVRLALGAGARSILAMVLMRGMVQLGIGLALGLAAAFAVTRLMTRLLFQVSPQDPVTFAGVALLLIGAGLAACWIPARRAASLDPLRALRYE